MFKYAGNILLFILLATHACSQDSSQYKYSQDSSIRTTVIRQGKFSSVLYTSNGRVLAKEDIKDRVLLYELPAVEFRKYKTARTATLFWGVTSVASLIVAAVESNQYNQGAKNVFLGVAVSGLMLELISAIQVGRHWDRSIRLYNKRFLP